MSGRPNSPPAPSPRFGSARQEEEEEERRPLLDESRRRVERIVNGFIDFAFQGNVLEIAFGLIIASMFTNLVTSFVSDILLPPLSVLLPINKNLEEKFAVLRPGPNRPYNTLQQAQDDGAVVMAYGYVFSLDYLPTSLPRYLGLAHEAHILTSERVPTASSSAA